MEPLNSRDSPPSQSYEAMGHVTFLDRSTSASAVNSYRGRLRIDAPQPVPLAHSKTAPWIKESYSGSDVPKLRPQNHYVSRAKFLILERQRHELWKMIKKSFGLLFSLKTVLVQLEAFIFIFLCQKIDQWAAYDFTKHVGLSIDIRVVSLMVSFCIIFTISESFRRRERALQVMWYPIKVSIFGAFFI